MNQDSPRQSLFRSINRIIRVFQARQPGFRSVVLGLVVLLALAAAGTVLAQSLPQVQPNGSAGMTVFSNRCANCHGAQGLGDGELAANLPSPPASLASADYIRAAVPNEMFDTITNGRLDAGMPPFGPSSTNPLDEQERWHAIAAVYSLATPAESVVQGQTVYEENCLACHGENGLGDGPEAAALDTSAGDLSSMEYWFGRSNQMVFDSLAGGEINDHDYDLTESELWSTVDFIRTFSYGYLDVQAMFRPLEAATISGQVTNGTTGEPLTGEGQAIAQLRGFTVDLQITLDMTTTVGTDGRFHFDLTDVSPEWFFRIGVTYKDIEFGSDFGQISFVQREIELPVTVYEKATDPAAISVNQLHIVAVFGNGVIEFSELYVVSNNDQTVFVGPGGDVTQGTFEIELPADAQQPTFQRGFGSLDSFLPANEVIPTDDGWADTLPVRPGGGTLNLLVSYILPYEDGATITHALNYHTTSVNLVIPDAGIQVGTADGWVSGGQQAMGNTAVSTYSQSNLPAGSTLRLALTGEPSATGSVGSALSGNNTAELLIGGGVILIAAAVAVFAVRRWRGEGYEDMDADELIQALADLDDEYEAGLIDEEEYLQERDDLKAELLAIWEEEG
jgi:mono/diheme cytochrome c family protein